MKKLIHLLVIGILLSGLTFGQEKEINLNLKSTEKIESVSIAKEMFSVITNNNDVHVYDIEGNRRGSINIPSNKYINYHSVSQNTNSLIVAEANGNTDLVKAININNNSINWQLELNAANYDLSENGKYLLTRNTRDEGPDNFSVVNIENGALIGENLNIKNYYSSFLDDERVVIFTQGYERNPEYDKTRFYELKSQKSKIMQKITRLTLKLRKSYDSSLESDLEEKQKEYDELDDEFEKEVKKLSSSGKTIPSAGKIIIYNIKTESVEHESELYSDQGKKILIRVPESLIKNVNISSEKEIFLFCEIERKPALVKIGQNYNILWNKLLGSRIYNYKIKLKGNPIFKVLTPDNELKFIDNTNGDFVTEINSLNEFKEDLKSAKSNVINLDSRIKVKEENENITIIKREN